MLVKLNVPEELYLDAVRWLAARTEPAADPAPRATMTALNGTNLRLSQLVEELRAELEKVHEENWSLHERLKIDAGQARHEAPEPPPAGPEPAPAPETPAEPHEGAHEAPEPPRPMSEREAAVAMFLDDMLVPAAADNYVTAAELVEAYEAWRHDCAAPPVEGRQLGRFMHARGVNRQQITRASASAFGGKRPVVYLGVTLKGAEPAVLPKQAVRVHQASGPGRELQPEFRDLVKEVTTLHPDWVYQRTNGSRRGKPRLIAPSGKRVMLPNTPSDNRALLNTRATLRRLGAQV